MNKCVNYTIPLYFDQSLSYLEMVGNLEKQMQDVKGATDNLLQAIKYEDGKTKVTGDLDVSGKISGDIEISGGTITADVIGNASTASKLETSRQIALSGDVTGSANFDGSSNIDIVATVGKVDEAVEADKWSTPRTLSLTGNATGSTTIDGSGNIVLDVTVTSSSTEITGTEGDFQVRGDLLVEKTEGGSLVEKDITVSKGDINLATGYALRGNVVGNVTGVATSAQNLNNLTVGSATAPVYFNGGVPTACAETLGVSISGSAASATVATNAGNVTSSIGGQALANIFENNGTTVKLATGASTALACSGTAYNSTHTSAIRYGTSDPSNSDGNDGDIYVKYSAE